MALHLFGKSVEPDIEEFGIYTGEDVYLHAAAISKAGYLYNLNYDKPRGKKISIIEHNYKKYAWNYYKLLETGSIYVLVSSKNLNEDMPIYTTKDGAMINYSITFKVEDGEARVLEVFTYGKVKRKRILSEIQDLFLPLGIYLGFSHIHVEKESFYSSKEGYIPEEEDLQYENLKKETKSSIDRTLENETGLDFLSLVAKH